MRKVLIILLFITATLATAQTHVQRCDTDTVLHGHSINTDSLKKVIKRYKMQDLNDSVSCCYELLVSADTTNWQNLTDAGFFETQDMANYDKALQYYECALRHARNDTQKAQTYVNLSVVYVMQDVVIQGDYTRFEDALQKALALQLALYGEKHHDVADSYDNLGSCYSGQGDNARAEQYYKKALQIYIALYGKKHPDVAWTYNNLGNLYSSQHDYAQAETCYQKALNIAKVVMGEEHPNTKIFQRSLDGVKAHCKK